MEFETIYQFASYIGKVILVVAIIILIFNSGHFIDKKLKQYLPKLPKGYLYILIGILSILWFLAKLFGFGLIDASN